MGEQRVGHEVPTRRHPSSKPGTERTPHVHEVKRGESDSDDNKSFPLLACVVNDILRTAGRTVVQSTDGIGLIDKHAISSWVTGRAKSSLDEVGAHCGMTERDEMRASGGRPPCCEDVDGEREYEVIRNPELDGNFGGDRINAERTAGKYDELFCAAR
jgi:hypothetical protein